jgi:single-strand DNA-binding protein
MRNFKAQGVVRISSDITVSEVGETKVAKFSACDVETIGRGEEKQEYVHFFDFELWDSGADFLSKYAVKGDRLFVEALPRQDRWEKDGVKRSKVYYRITNFTIIPKREKVNE